MFSHNKPAEQIFKDVQKEEKRTYLNNFPNFAPTMVGGEEHFAVLEALKRLLQHFLLHSLHVAA